MPDKRDTVQVIRLSPRLRTKNNSASVDSDPFSSDFEHLIGDDDYLSGSVISADLESLDWDQCSSVDDIVQEEDSTSEKIEDPADTAVERPEVIDREASQESEEVFEPERLPPFPPPSPAEVRVSPAPSTPSPPPPLLPPTPPPPFVEDNDNGLEHDLLSSDDDTFQVSSYQSSLTQSSAVSHVTSTDTIPYIDDTASARSESTGSRDSTPIPRDDDHSVTPPPDDDQQYSYSLSRRNNARARGASYENVDIVRYTIATAAAQKNGGDSDDDHRSSANRSNAYEKKDEMGDTLMVT